MQEQGWSSCGSNIDKSSSSRPRKRKGAPSKDLGEECLLVGRQFITEALDLLRKRISTRRALRAHCYCHGHQCSAKFIGPLGFPDGLMVHVAGFSCTDWSSMGVGEGWLGKTSLVFAQWLAEQMETPDQDFLVTECASKFDVSIFAWLVGERYELTVIHVSPELFGEPTQRNRMCMILLEKSRRQWCLQGSAQEVYEQTSPQALRECAGEGNGKEKKAMRDCVCQILPNVWSVWFTFNSCHSNLVRSRLQSNQCPADASDPDAKKICPTQTLELLRSSLNDFNDPMKGKMKTDMLCRESMQLQLRDY